MTDQELAEELAATLRAVADAYDTSDAMPTGASPRRRGMPILLAAAAALALLAGIGVVLWGSADDAADLDTRNDPTSTPAPTTAPPSDEVADPWGGWTWTVGAPASVEPRTGHEISWSTDELAIWAGDQGPDTLGRAAAAYNPASDTWRELSSTEVEAAQRLRDDPTVAIAAGVEPPTPHEAFDGILTGTVDATPLVEGGPAPWTLTGDGGGEVTLPDLPDPFGFGFSGARAVWTGDALVIWGGHYDCGPGASCAYFGPSEAFVLSPPAQPTGAPTTVDLPIGDGEPIDLSEYADVTWVLYSIEVDGEVVDDDELGTIVFQVNPAGPRPAPLPLTATGWAGCDYTASLTSPGGALSWSVAPDQCGASTSAFASLFVERLADTEQANLLELWPTEFLELIGPDLRVLLVPAPDNNVGGPFTPPTPTAPPAAPPTTTAPPSAPEQPSGPTTSLADVIDAVWFLHSLEIDGSLVEDDEAGDITLEIGLSGLPSLDSAELGINGQAGCSYAAGVRVDGIAAIDTSSAGALTWHTPPGACGDASTLATAYLSRLGDTTSTALLDLSPTPFLELTGPGVRFLFAPVAPPPVTPPAPAGPPAPLVAPSEPVSTSGESSPALTWTLDTAPHGDLAGWSFIVGDEIITIADDVSTSALVSQGLNTVSGQWRALPPQPVLGGEILQAAIWTGDSIAVYTQGGGYAELLEYDPASDQWSFISGWEFFGSRYTTLVMEMRSGEIYIEGEAGGARWHIKPQAGSFGTYERIP